jgi:hypothetical protein
MEEFDLLSEDEYNKYLADMMPTDGYVYANDLLMFFDEISNRLNYEFDKFKDPTWDNEIANCYRDMSGKNVISINTNGLNDMFVKQLMIPSHEGHINEDKLLNIAKHILEFIDFNLTLEEADYFDTVAVNRNFHPSIIYTKGNKTPVFEYQLK